MVRAYIACLTYYCSDVQYDRAPASCASVNGIALENSSGDIEVRVPFIDKDNYAFRVWPQSHSAAINVR